MTENKKNTNPNNDEIVNIEDRGILVSICMIVKNEEANLKRCLDSLLPILHEPWCELIITDTGSTDLTVDIAKTYTDSVFVKVFEPWSFSDARNFCISYAKGKRVFTIDADHELPQACLYPLEELIWSKKYDNTTIFLGIRNILTADDRQYTEMLQPLLFINDGQPIYEGSVHNKPRTTAPFVFAENVYLNHRGYKFMNNPKLKKDKNDRSLPMLMAEYEKDPDNLHILTHLTKQVFVMQDFDATKKYGEIWLKKFRSVDFHEGWNSYLECIVNLVSAYTMTDDIDNALRVMEEAEKYSKRLFGIYHGIASWYVKNGQDDEATKYFQRCIEIGTTQGDKYELLTSNFNRMAVPAVYHWFSVYEFRRGNYEKAGEFMNTGIRLNEGRIDFRWDVWMDEQAQERLIKD